MRRPLPVLLLVVLALLLAGSLASNAANAEGVPQLVGSDYQPSSRVPVSAERGEQIARDFLTARAADYGATRDDMTRLRFHSTGGDDFSGTRRVIFVQTANDIEIHSAVVNVAIVPSGEILFVGNRSVANAQQNANTATPALSQTDAIAAAADALGLTYSPDSIAATAALGGAEQEIRYTGGDLSLEPLNVKLMYMPMADGSLRLSWNMLVYQLDAQHAWDVRVDALTGELLDKVDWVIHDNWDALLSDPGQVPTGAMPGPMNSITNFGEQITAQRAPAMVGSYRVFAIPTESPSHGGRTMVANPDNAMASPFGWHDTNGAAGAEFTTTQGNNVHAYTDVDANNTPDAGSSPDGGAGLLFDNPLDLTLAPSGYRPAAVTNLFYWNNIIHDVSWLYGFKPDEKNFQENNYGGGGTASDYVNAEAQDGSGTNNANFFSGSDGTNGRMQMYVWTAPTPDRDGDLDNGIILHEYGHGVSNRQTGTGAGCLSNAEQMGEGWSDWQSVMYTMRPGDTATTNRGVGTYALNQPITGVGIRPAPYNTNMAVNNYTYSNLPGMAVPHGVGFVWNTMLWEMNWGLIGVHGFNPNIYDYTAMTDGNTLAYYLVNEGMQLQPCSPGFVDGRNAILAADVALTGGTNACTIWTAFAKRGLGFSASQGSSSSSSDGTAAFDLPAACTGGPTPTPSATALPGGTLYCSNTPLTVPDNVPAGVSQTVNVPASVTISDINVVVTATHSWVGDYTIRIAHGADNVLFYDRPGVPASTFGCSGDNLPGIVADDEGGAGSLENSCTNATPAYTPGGHYTPNSPLSVFDGDNATGTWTLTIADNAAGDTGQLQGWCVEVSGGGGGPTATPTPITPTATATTQPGAPDINVTPGAYEETIPTNSTATDTMTIQNTGSGTLTWEVVEQGGPLPEGVGVLVPGALSHETVGASAPAPVAGNDGPVGKGFVPSGAVLYDNGPLVNLPGGGAGGADASALDTSLGLTLYGFGHAVSSGFRVADDFVVPAGETWNLSSITFFAYQTGSTTTSTINNVNLRIWDGVPGATGSNIVFGDTTTNRLATSVFSNIYRSIDTDPTNSQRPIMASTATVATSLPAGTYWLDWQTGGTLASGPWAPPITISGQTTTGNALQFDPTAGTWNAGLDGTFPQGLPFVIEGTGGGGGDECPAAVNIPWLSVSPANGSTAGGGSSAVTLTYDSTGLANGTYTGDLCIESNDADEPTVTVPVTLNVQPPTAIDLSSFESPMAGINPADFAAAGLLLLAGAALLLRRR